MVYSKEITTVILSDYAKGASAEETIKHLTESYGVTPNINTIYSHRKSLTAEMLIDELQRQQERDITKETNSDLRMKYRNELLKLLMPLRAEIISKSLNITKTEVQVNVSDMLKQYENLFEEATILEHVAPQPIHTTQANNQASTIPTT